MQSFAHFHIYIPTANPDSTILLQSQANWDEYSFLLPNEYNPESMLEITRLASPGSLISVGTERGFIAAAINPQISKLILIDNDPHVVAYNRFLIALLKVARSRGDFENMRAEIFFGNGPITHIFSRVKKETEIQLNEQSLALIRNKIANRPDALANGEPNAIGFNANYVLNPILYSRIAMMAKHNQISSYFVDIESKNSVTNFKRILPPDLKVTLIDLSNAWYTDYVNPNGVREFLQEMSLFLQEKSIVLMTGKPAGTFEEHRWEFFGIRAQSFIDEETFERMEDFLFKVNSYRKINFGGKIHFCESALSSF